MELNEEIEKIIAPKKEKVDELSADKERMIKEVMDLDYLLNQRGDEADRLVYEIHKRDYEIAKLEKDIKDVQEVK